MIIEGGDPTGVLLAHATAHLGHATTLVDLRRARVELRTGPGGGVRFDGVPLDVDVVVNRTGINGLGLAPPAALQRQVGATWYELHSAAREEQGLLLAVFDWFELNGVRVINPPEAVEMESMRNLVIERSARRGVAITPSETVNSSYLVTGGRVALQQGQDRPTTDVLSACKLVSESALFDIGEVRFGTGGTVVGWTSRPHLAPRDVGVARALAGALMEELIGRSGSATVPPGRPLIPDMVERFEQS